MSDTMTVMALTHDQAEVENAVFDFINEYEFVDGKGHDLSEDEGSIADMYVAQDVTAALLNDEPFLAAMLTWLTNRKEQQT